MLQNPATKIATFVPVGKFKMNILISAGGTGGDLFPAVAVSEQLAQLTGKNFSADFVGNPSRIEARVVPQLGYGFYPIPVTGFKGLFHPSTLALAWRILRSEYIVGSLLDRKKPVGMICGGTYISFPAARAAFRRRIPVMLIEPNVIPGKTNRLLAPKVQRIIAAFEESKEHFPASVQKKMIITGNPVRESLTLTLPDRTASRTSFGLQPELFTVFVFGGSLGARALNLAVEAVLPALAMSNFQIIWQTGANYTPPAVLPANVITRTFIENMAPAYSAADIVLCRAGGGTVAELGNVGRPAMLVPLPSAANNEQLFNARAVERMGAGIMIENDHIGVRFMPLLVELAGNPQRLAAMTAAARLRARPNAARHAAEEFLKMINQSV